jgi:Helicase associated domain
MTSLIVINLSTQLEVCWGSRKLQYVDMAEPASTRGGSQSFARAAMNTSKSSAVILPSTGGSSPSCKSKRLSDNTVVLKTTGQSRAVPIRSTGLHHDTNEPFSSRSKTSDVEVYSTAFTDDTTLSQILAEMAKASRRTRESNSLTTSRPPRRQAAATAMYKLAAAAATEPSKPAVSAKKRQAEDVDEANPAHKRQATPNKGVATDTEAAIKRNFPRSWGDVSKIRVLKPVVESVDFGAVGEQVKVEFAELCQSDQPDDPFDLSWVAKANRRFETGFVDFLAFRKIYGHPLVPKYFPERPSLGGWVQEVRQWKTSNRQDRLSSHRMNRLNEAGFVWDAAAHPLYRIALGNSKQSDERWEKKFQQLLEYKAKNGHCNVPKEDLYEKVPAVRACY